MGFVAHSPPNISAAQAAYGPQIGDGPVETHKFVGLPLSSKVSTPCPPLLYWWYVVLNGFG